MDNRTIDVVSKDDEGIALALALIWPNAKGGNATHYLINRYSHRTRYMGEDGVPTHHFTDTVVDQDGTWTLIFFWCEDGDSVPLPYPLDLDGAVDFIKNWLKTTDFGPKPDHDGVNRKGWRIFAEQWGHVAGNRGAFVGIQPAWAMHGK